MMDEQKIMVTWDDVADFTKFVDKEEHVYAIRNWNLNIREESDYSDKEKKVKKIRFTCDVVGKDGKLVSEKIGTSSIRFLLAIKPVLKLKVPNDIVFVSITKVGVNSATNYLVKEVPATNLRM